MKLHVLDNGVLVLGEKNPVIREESKGDADSNCIPVHSFLIDTPVGYVLFDCACDDEGMKVWPEWLRETPYEPGKNGIVTERIKEMGISPDDIKYVVLSHMHVDHMGCLKYFPKAKTFVSAKEFISVMRNYSLGKLDGTFHVKTDIDNCLQAGIQWQLVYEDKLQLCEGVTIYNFGSGHSFGMLGILVKTDKANYMLSADAVYSAAHFGPPAQMAGVCADEEGYFATIERIRKLAEENNAEVLFGHDMKQFKGLLERSNKNQL